MNPGPELDRLVAEKVMGWTGSNGEAWKANGIATDYVVGGADLGLHPSTNIAHAWEVVDHLRKTKKVHIIVWPDDVKDVYQAADFTEQGFGDHWIDGDIDRLSEAPSAPHAICLAALRAIGEKI